VLGGEGAVHHSRFSPMRIAFPKADSFNLCSPSHLTTVLNHLYKNLRNHCAGLSLNVTSLGRLCLGPLLAPHISETGHHGAAFFPHSSQHQGDGGLRRAVFHISLSHSKQIHKDTAVSFVQRMT
jgi:hypothetical protein